MKESNTIDQIIAGLEDWERLPLVIVVMAGPWLTPMIPAYFVAVAIQRYLGAPLPIAVIAGLVLEVVGIAGIANATRAYMWNRTRRKTDEPAPLGLSIAAISIYFFTALLLTVILELWGQLAPVAPGMFIVLSISSGLILVLSSMQRQREKRVQAEKQERKQKRKYTEPKNSSERNNWPEPGRNTRRKAAAILAERPGISGADLGRELGRSDRLGRKLKAELLPEIAINGNGNGHGGDL